AADLDNDGDPDLAAVTAGGEAWLLRNRREDFAAEPLAVAAAGVTQLLAGDLDGDGDLDLAAGRPDGPARRWRNDGAERNQWLRLRLRGLPDNNGKTNTQGLFVRIEVRSGGDVQLVPGNGAVNHLGLGARREADVLRVVWTNGLAQTWSRVAARQTLAEEQVLKGSCPFLYAWNGERFEFVTDLMWKSPLGMILPTGLPASHRSARDFVRIPGEALRPAGDELWLQVTEELWETAYVDRQRLLAVDHPGDLELVVDERFTPPPHSVEPPLHLLGETRPPSAALDHGGRDVLPLLTARDGRHVDELPLDRYQGVTRGHHLDLVFDSVPAGGRLRLVLWGWILPTDTSINFALAQDASRDAAPPTLSLRRPDGSWEALPVWVGFPNGKRKALVVDLTGLLPAGRVELRLATSMQIYWDAARLAVGDAPAVPRITALDPVAADLHYRGYSRLVRESPTGPHLFEYETVEVEPRFRDMRGRFTRFGPVTPLLAAEDDQSVVMNAGDELTVRYDATKLPPLPAGWRRDWVLYTDGWVKDADLHTRASQTVEPLPYHAMTAYPGEPHRFPATSAHQRYLATYQTRAIDDRAFR
ncbi:MAG: FG-GAP-like repeat-containing protein, partial [Thermoanaerobaculia bacterium]